MTETPLKQCTCIGIAKNIVRLPQTLVDVGQTNMILIGRYSYRCRYCQGLI